MQFIVDMRVENAAFRSEEEHGDHEYPRAVEVARILDTVSDALIGGYRFGRLMDINGATVGWAGFREEPTVAEKILGTPFMGPTDAVLRLCGAASDNGHPCHRTPHEDNLHVRQHEGVIVAAWHDDSTG